MQPTKPEVKECDLIAVEIREAEHVDNGVTIAALDYMLSHNLLRQSRHAASAPAVVIVTTDAPPTAFTRLCDRHGAPPHAIIDAFSQWYPTDSTPTPPSPSANLVHIAGHHGHPDALIADITQAVQCALERRGVTTEQPRIVLIDSLTSVLRFANGLKFLMLLRRAFSATSQGSAPLSVLVTLRAHETGTALCSAVCAAASTHVRLQQPSSIPRDAARGSVQLHVRRRKPSGRVHLETITADLRHADGLLANAVVTPGHARDKPAVAPLPVDEQHNVQLAERGLSFRISLSSKEREMRAAAGLPYLHRDESLADSALELHPKSLQIGEQRESRDSEDDDSDIEEDDDEDLFSEDV